MYTCKHVAPERPSIAAIAMKTASSKNRQQRRDVQLYGQHNRSVSSHLHFDFIFLNCRVGFEFSNPLN